MRLDSTLVVATWLILLSPAIPRRSTGGLHAQDLPIPADTTGLPGSGTFAERVARYCQQLEALEMSGELGPSYPARLIGRALQRADAYLDSHRGDTRMLLLAARLARLQQVVASPPIPPTAYPPIHAYLDRALANDEPNAEAYYWKARLYGMSARSLTRGIDSLPDSAAVVLRALGDSVERFGRRAVGLGLQELPYREALALVLADNDRPDAAMATLGEVAGGRHPIYILLADREMLPLPSNATPWLIAQRRFGANYHSRIVADYWGLRYRVFVLPMRAGQLEAFFRTYWPGLQFFEVKDEGGGTRRVAQFLRMSGTTLEPARRKRDLEQLPDDPPDGFLVEAEEISSPTPGWLPGPLPIPPGDGVTLLTVIDMRNVGAPLTFRYAAVAAEHYTASMKSDLHNLAKFQEAYFADSGSYFSRVACAQNPGAGTVPFCASTGHTLSIVAVGSGPQAGWTATIRHATIATRCAIYVGAVAPAAPATKDDPEGVPVCH
jgi:hypothetical protein